MRPCLIALLLQFAFFVPRSICFGLPKPSAGREGAPAIIPEGAPARRLHIISVTGRGKRAEFSIVAQRSWEKRLAKSDNYTNVCDTDCGEVMVDGQRLKNILPMEKPWWSGRGYGEAAFKFVWGFVHEYRRMLSEGGPMPKWWFIKDDDTYVHVDRLMALAAKYDPNQRVLIARLSRVGGCTGSRYALHGGGGWLASAAMAEALVVEHGDEWLKQQEHAIRRHHCVAYDNQMGLILEKVAQANIVQVGHRFFHKRFQWEEYDSFCPPYPDLITFQMKKQSITEDPVEMTKLTESCFHEPDQKP